MQRCNRGCQGSHVGSFLKRDLATTRFPSISREPMFSYSRQSNGDAEAHTRCSTWLGSLIKGSGEFRCERLLSLQRQCLERCSSRRWQHQRRRSRPGSTNGVPNAKEWWTVATPPRNSAAHPSAEGAVNASSGEHPADCTTRRCQLRHRRGILHSTRRTASSKRREVPAPPVRLFALLAPLTSPTTF